MAHQLADEKQDIAPVDLRLSVTKSLGAKWMIELFNHFKNKIQKLSKMVFQLLASVNV